MSGQPREDEVLVFTTLERDAELAVRFLKEAGLRARRCATPQALFEEMAQGAGAVVLAEEALTPEAQQGLLDTLRRQPDWSDIPLIVFVRDGDTIDPILDTLGSAANVTILERPVRVRTLVGAASAALRARRRQYQIRELLQRLEVADRRKDEFLAVLGHELRNPISAIRLSLQMLNRLEPSGPAGQRYRETIRRQTDQLALLVEDLLDVARITSGKIELRRTAVDLNEAVRQVAATFELQARERGHTLRVETPGVPMVVEADGARLEQMVGNLLHNAIKYTPAGGTITLAVARDFERAAVRVSDSGIGLDAEQLQRIFEPFVQIRTGQKLADGGLGLGLSLVRRLAELHGGEITAASPGPGMGSTFGLILPLHVSAQDERQSPGPLPRSNLRVLVVQPDAPGALPLPTWLQAWGCEVRTARSVDDGLQAAAQLRPHVAVVQLGADEAVADAEVLARRLRTLLGSRLRLVAVGDTDEDVVLPGYDHHLPARLASERLPLVLQ